MSDPVSLSLTLPNENATASLAARLARLLRPGDMVALDGPLGAGKSTLARALIRTLTTPGEEVPSPTFTLVQTYETPDFEIWHFDLYRIGEPVEIMELGWEEARDQVTLVEWPERLGGLWPEDALHVTLTAPADAPEARAVRLSGLQAQWDARLAALDTDD